ncbi:MAG: ferrous iron transport protein A [Velocimicrobium sp.]
MSVLNGQIGTVYIVESLQMKGTTLRRLEALGLTLGTKITVLNNKKSGTVIFMVRGTRLAVGRKIASAILIREESA